MATKRVILANGSRLLREMLRRVIDRTGHLEIVQEIPVHEELPSAIERLGPEWVFISLPSDQGARRRINVCIARYPAVRFVLFSPDNSSIKMKWQTVYEEDLTNLSLQDFVQILEKDLQHI